MEEVAAGREGGRQRLLYCVRDGESVGRLGMPGLVPERSAKVGFSMQREACAHPGRTGRAQRPLQGPDVTRCSPHIDVVPPEDVHGRVELVADEDERVADLVFGGMAHAPELEQLLQLLREAKQAGHCVVDVRGGGGARVWSRGRGGVQGGRGLCCSSDALRQRDSRPRTLTESGVTGLLLRRRQVGAMPVRT